MDRIRYRLGWMGALVLALAAPWAVSAPTGEVIGTVTSGATGQPLHEVQVAVGGTNLGALTNGAGRFIILNVPAGTRTVTATLIGYGERSQEVTVTTGGTTTVDFTLFSQAVELEGVVITGTAIAAQRREIGNSVSLITSEEIEAAGVVNIDDVLRGKAPGMTVQGTTGVAGAGSQILLRGLSSINGRNRPLIYVDGVRMNDRGAYESSGSTGGQAATVLNSINPQDIDRIEIIKGAAAATLYGTEATAGVIQIFTKQGSQGVARWTFTTEQGLAQPRKVGPDEDPTGLHLNDCTTGGPLRPDQTEPDPGCPESGSWLRTAYNQEYSLNVRGGGEELSYFGSASWGKQEGIANVPEPFDPQAAENLTLRGNFTFTPASRLRIRVNNAYTRRDISWIPDGDNARGFTENVTKLDLGETPDNNDALIFESDIDQAIDHFTTSANLNFQATDNFQHRLNIGLDWSQSRTIQFDPLGFFDFPDGSRTVDTENTRMITLDYAGSFFADLTDSWTSTFSWGGQFNDREDTGFRVDCIGFIAPGTRVSSECRDASFESGAFGLQEDRRGFRNGGGFLEERFGWNNRFFLSFGLRADAFSQINRRLEQDFAFLYYPKVQATYSLSDHAFWPSWWDTFRLRAAWGESGDPPPQTANQTLWQIAGADELPGSGFIIQTLANPGIVAERTSEFEGGIDASLLGGRVNAQATGFYRKTTDGIINNPLLPSDGVVESIPFNEGRWTAWGVETGVDFVALETDGLRVNVLAQYQWFDNRIHDLGALGQGDPESVNTGFNQRFTEGKSFPQFFGEPVSNPDEFALPQRDTTQVLGRSIPNQELSLGFTAYIGDRLSFDVFGSGQFGHLLLDEGAEEAASDGVWPQCVGVDDNLLAHVNDGEPLTFTAGEIARCSRFNSVGGVALDDQNEDWLFSGDYFRIQSASLSYRVPERWLPGGLGSATVQFRATNLALFTDYPTGTDPDALLGGAINELFRSAGFTLPAPRTYSLRVRVTY